MSLTLPPHSVRSLAELVAALPTHEIRGDADAGVAGVTHRSDDAAPGSLFFCVPGAHLDGHTFAADAVAGGASVLTVERWLPLDVTQVRVPIVREAMGPVSAAFFGRPSQRMRTIGVTGTNGKTTITYLLESIFRQAGFVPGLVGTTGAHVDGVELPFPRTTPEAPDLQRLLAEMIQRGVDAVAMEVSSHGLEQHRVDGTRFEVVVFTNLSQDHLDHHGTMEAYFRAKARLFSQGFADAAVVDVDSDWGQRMLDAAGSAGVPTTSIGTSERADLRAVDVEATTAGVSFRVDDLTVTSTLRGAFNVSNALAALATARALGISDDAIARGIAGVGKVPGRVESVDEGQGFLVLVDYAHTPDGLENVLRAARELTTGRVIAVFGCGGDRDRAKRPLMGAAATRSADLTLITSDNPRSEDPAAIIAEIEAGAREGGGTYWIESDRRSAIRRALDVARPGDVVVVAGKGHEVDQEFLDRTIPFDDRIVVAEELRAGREDV